MLTSRSILIISESKIEHAMEAGEFDNLPGFGKPFEFQILTKQAERWNAKDIEGFMGTYWKSEKLTFCAGGKTTRGWQATLDRYKANYPPEKMGKLTFDNLETTMLNESAAFVLGQWHLQFAEKNEETGKLRADGNFSLVLRKLEDEWKIVHDHSSSIEPPK